MCSCSFSYSQRLHAQPSTQRLPPSWCLAELCAAWAEINSLATPHLHSDSLFNVPETIQYHWCLTPGRGGGLKEWLAAQRYSKLRAAQPLLSSVSSFPCPFPRRMSSDLQKAGGIVLFSSSLALPFPHPLPPHHPLPRRGRGHTDQELHLRKQNKNKEVMLLEGKKKYFLTSDTNTTMFLTSCKHYYLSLIFHSQI